MPNDAASSIITSAKPRVNFLANIPLTSKQRAVLIHQFLQRARPALPALARLRTAEALQKQWTDTSTQSLDEVLDAYESGPAPLFWPWLASDVWFSVDPIALMAEDALAIQVEEVEDKDYVEELEDTETEEELQKPKKHESFSLDIVLNNKQQLAVDFAKIGKSFVLTGAAGTGKTTAEREIVKALLHAWKESGAKTRHKFKDKRSATRHWLPPIAVVSFTNKAANNSAKAIHKDPELEAELPYNITTIHNLLEFEPVFFERPDGTTGMRFEPARNSANPLDCKTICIEEASNVGALDLYQHLYSAIRPGTTLIFIGDINQLPPIFSPSILNYALVQLPVVELTEVYRQAMDSPIIKNAHNILAGRMVEPSTPHFMHFNGAKLTKLLSEVQCVRELVKTLKKQVDLPDPEEPWTTVYDPEQDIVLSPYNVGDAGTININNHIAQFLGQRRDAEVYEIIARMRKLYLAVGDHVFFMKKEGKVIKITPNARYVGKMPQEPGRDLTRWGVRIHTGIEHAHSDRSFEEMVAAEEIEIDKIDDESDDGKVRAASHIVDIVYDDGSKDILSTVGDLHEANFSLGYALTVHKSQGSEWRKVYFLIHKQHATHLNREIVYTAVTRARTHCWIVDFTNQLEKGIRAQRIKGNTVQDKIAWFNSEISLKEPIEVCKNY